MGVLFLFLLISVLVISALLFFNKGEKAQEIKSVLKDIYANFKDLFYLLKKLFLILKELIQEKTESDPTQPGNKSSGESSNETTSLSSQVSSSLAEAISVSDSKLDTSVKDSDPELNKSKSEESSEKKFDSSSELDSFTQDVNLKTINSSLNAKTQLDIPPSKVDSLDENPINENMIDKKNE